jgi:hypothetical protein
MEAIGPDQTDALLTYLPPTGWADVATTRDVQALGESLRGELRGEIGQLRGEMGALGATLRAELHHELRVQFYALATLMVALLGLTIAVFSTGLLG